MLLNYFLYLPNKCSVLFVSKPKTLPKRKARSLGLSARAHGFSADPLSDIALWNNPAANGDNIKNCTEAAPADSPNSWIKLFVSLSL